MWECATRPNKKYAFDSLIENIASWITGDKEFIVVGTGDGDVQRQVK